MSYDRIIQKRNEFVGLVLRGSGVAIYDEIIEGNIRGKRDKGRKSRTWINDLKDWTDMKAFYALK